MMGCYIPSLVSSVVCSLRVANDIDLTITTFRPGTDRDLETVASAAPFCIKLTIINLNFKKFMIYKPLKRAKSCLNQSSIWTAHSLEIKNFKNYTTFKEFLRCILQIFPPFR